MGEERATSKPRPAGRAIVLALAVVLIIILAAIFWHRNANRASRPWRDKEITASFFYMGIGPAPAAKPSPTTPIGVLRLHYRVRNNGESDYTIPPSAELIEFQGAVTYAARPGIGRELPGAIPPRGEGTLVITIPYKPEYLPPEEWSRLYPERELPEMVAEGIPRLALTIEDATQILRKRDVPAESLLQRFDIVGEAPPRESPALARAILGRQYPLITGFALLDHERHVRVDLPLPQGR